MYLEFFGLKERPFNLTPDPRFLFLSASHREAFDHLLYGIHQKVGFIEVVGGIGTGKTTLCRALLEELEGRVATALIFNTFLSEIDLLKTINQEFGIKYHGETRKALIDALNEFLIDQLSQGGNACLVLDECQNLSPRVLEQIRMLSNLETENEKLIQIVLVGQPEFHHMLKSTGLKQLDERIQVRAFLRPLDPQETKNYVLHRLTVAGARGDIQFSDGAMNVIYSYSMGNPRRINTICDRCLLIAYVQETFKIGRNIAEAALAELRQGESALSQTAPAVTNRPPGRGLSWMALAFLGVLGIFIGLLLGQWLVPRAKDIPFARRLLSANQMGGIVSPLRAPISSFILEGMKTNGGSSLDGGANLS
jgi:general secretion pathway protein A